MNRRGFTLIELLAVIVLVAIIAVLIFPSLLSSVSKSNAASHKIMIDNIITASKMYYEECEYGDLSNSTKYGDYACKIEIDTNGNNYIETTIDKLTNTGFLTGTYDKENDKKIVIDPQSKENINECTLEIKKEKNEETGKITYQVILKKTEICPEINGSVN